MIIIAVLAPILGAISDYARSKKQFLMFFAFMGAIASALMAFVGEGNYLLASFLVILGTIGFSGGNVFYDGFLPEITDHDNIDRISTRGYALGYLGGGVLLFIDLMMIQFPSLFFLPDTITATKLSFVSVGIWWIVFSIPFFRHVHEQKNPDNAPLPLWRYPAVSFSRIRTTMTHIKHYRELVKFLIAFFLFNDGISTIIKMATVYGRELGIGSSDLIAALLITQFVGIPFSLLFGKIAGTIGAKRALYIALLIYIGITLGGSFMSTALHFYILAVIVGFVQGGSQALSRSIYGSMIPVNRTSEFFGFYGVSNKFSAILGPMLFGMMTQLTGSGRGGIFSLLILFVLGLILLTTVDVEKGRREARVVHD